MAASEDSKLIRQVYAGALQRDPEERLEYLDQACAGNPSLRARVLALLDRHSGEFTDTGSQGRPLDPARDSRHALEAIEGRTIGPYILRRELGRGGMGVVYLADDTRLSRRVALKALTPGLGRELASRDRLRLEARAAAALSHPGIATVYALEEIGDELYLACEYVPGEPLRALVESGPLPVHDVVQIGVQLARALSAAHTQGIVHRDIKPENIVKTPSGVVKVLDFGLARMEGPSRMRLTQTGVILGTPAYLSPEQALGQAVDFRTDIFALGLLLYELASGVNPFADTTVTTTIARIVETELAPLSAVCQDSGPELDRIVATCLRKDPLERYRSTQDVVADLEHLAEEMAGARRGTESARVSGATPREVRPSALWWWQVHQLAVSIVYVLMLYPAWRVRAWLPAPWGMLFLFTVLASAAAATSVRLHLWFTSRYFPGDLGAQQTRTRLWTRASDIGFAASQVIAALGISSAHPEIAMLLVAVSTATLVAALVIEPATARAAISATPVRAPTSRASSPK